MSFLIYGKPNVYRIKVTIIYGINVPNGITLLWAEIALRNDKILVMSELCVKKEAPFGSLNN